MSVKPAGRVSSAPIVTSIIVAIAALHLGREVLIPFALAVLISFLLAPLVIWLQRYIGRIFAVIAVSTVSLIFVAAIGWLVVDQIGDLASKVPERRQAIVEKIRTLRNSVRSDLGMASQTVEEITKEISGAPAEATSADVPIGPPATNPVPQVKVVESVESKTTSGSSPVWSWLGTVTAPLAKAAVIIVFVIFMLIYYDDLRDRILRLIGTGRLNESTQAINDAAERVSRYLLMQSVINASHGVAVAIGLYFLGVPSALFFGLNSALLRFIPYVGPVLAAAMPIALTLAVTDGWSTPIYTILFFIILELVSNNVLEPWLYGSSTGLSPMAVIVAAVFWSWLWGPIGLVLSAPLTVCLVVMGKHIAQLNFLNILLSDQPVLEPKDRFYQRLLVMDQEGAFEVAEKYLEDHPLEEVYDHVILPGLAMSEVDRHHGSHAADRAKFIIEHTRDIIEQLEEVSRKKNLKKAEEAVNARIPPKRLDAAPNTNAIKILCVPARDEADELAGHMFVQLLRRDGHEATCVPVDTLAGESMDLIEQGDVDIVCISALPPMGITHARYMYKRVRAKFEDKIMLACLWTMRGDALKAVNRSEQDENLKGVATIIEGQHLVHQLAEQIVLRKAATGLPDGELVASRG